MVERIASIKKDTLLSLRSKCQLLGINRSVLYYKHHSENDDIDLLNLIRDIWLKHTFYGYRKITAVLKLDYQLEVNRKRVLRLMKIGGIAAVYPKPNLSKNNVQHKVYPYLLNNFLVTKINQVWQIDITYLKLGTRFVYLVALIDVHSRYIVGWSLSFELDTENCLDALYKALKIAIPEIINSDQGCQFTSECWIKFVLDQNIKISMDGKGRCKDNIFIERFWRSIKYEAYYLNEYISFTDLYKGVNDYVEFYNKRRPHQNLGYLRPSDVYLKGMLPFGKYKKELKVI